jgi:hypothetical protein
MPHLVGFDPGMRVADDAGHRLQSMATNRLAACQHQGRRAVVDRRGIAGRHSAVLANTGRNPASFSAVVPGRTFSSVSKARSVLPSLTVTARIWLAKRFSSIARAARVWLSAANAS